jgi:hypothetical protein
VVHSTLYETDNGCCNFSEYIILNKFVLIMTVSLNFVWDVINIGNKKNEIVMSKNDGKNGDKNDYNNDSSFEVTDKELEWSEKVFKKKEQEKLKKEKNPKSVKKRERSFIEKFIGTPKTKKNRKSEFLF